MQEHQGHTNVCVLLLMCVLWPFVRVCVCVFMESNDCVLLLTLIDEELLFICCHSELDGSN